MVRRFTDFLQKFSGFGCLIHFDRPIGEFSAATFPFSFDSYGSHFWLSLAKELSSLNFDPYIHFHCCSWLVSGPGSILEAAWVVVDLTAGCTCYRRASLVFIERWPSETDILASYFSAATHNHVTRPLNASMTAHTQMEQPGVVRWYRRRCTSRRAHLWHLRTPSIHHLATTLGQLWLLAVSVCHWPWHQFVTAGSNWWSWAATDSTMKPVSKELCSNFVSSHLNLIANRHAYPKSDWFGR